MTRLAAMLVAALAVVASACGGSGNRLEGDLLITADRVFDGKRVIADGAVLVVGRKIVAVGTEDELDAGAERTIALGDGTVLPGFIDLHVHAFGGGVLYRGVTTVRDLGSFIESMPPPPERQGELRVLASGPIITVPGGYPGTVHDQRVGYEIRGTDAARRAVRLMIRRGASVIKISLEPGGTAWPMLSKAEVAAIVAEAHRWKLKVTAHVSEDRGVRVALDGGVDELAHMPCAIAGSLLREVAERRVPIVGTLHIVRESGCSPWVVGNARTFVEAGGRLLYGSDFGNRPIPAGIDVEELRLMVAAGLSRTEVLASATRVAGEYLGKGPLGSLVAGAPADVIGVEGNPLETLAVLAKPEFIVSGGRVVVAPPRN